MDKNRFLNLKFQFEYSNFGEKFSGVYKFLIDIYRLDETKVDLIGKMIAYKFVCNQIEDMFWALDLERETVPFLELFNNNSFSNKVLNTAKCPTPYLDLLILDRLELLPEFRGFGYAKIVFEMIEETIGFNCLMAMIPFPLQFEAEGKPMEVFGKEWKQKMCFGKLPLNFANASRGLNQYYKSCGFRKVSKLAANIFVKSKR